MTFLWICALVVCLLVWVNLFSFLWFQRKNATHNLSNVAQTYKELTPVEKTKLDPKDISWLNSSISGVINTVSRCSKVSWDLWEMDSPADAKAAIYDWKYNPNNVGVVDGNKRVKYCGTKDEFVSEMMGLSLSYDIVDMKAVKSLDGSHGIIMLLVCLSGDGTTNIEPDAIEALSSPLSPEAVGDYGIAI